VEKLYFDPRTEPPAPHYLAKHLALHVNKPMPKLLTDRPKARRKLPPCGRIIKYLEPHSPFQRLIDDRRRELAAKDPDLSVRGLARRLSAALAPQNVSQSTLWIWLHNENGYPHPKSFKDEHLQALSRVLKLPEEDIRKAIDASRVMYQPKRAMMPVATRDAFKAFIDIMSNDRREVLARTFVLNLAKSLYNGATGEKV